MNAPSSCPKSAVSCSLLLLLVASFVASVRADPMVDTLWYSGDPNINGANWGNDATTNTPFGLTHWQKFVVSDAAGWTITDVFSLGTSYGSPTAEWSIRSGMSYGNPGTLVAGGSGAYSVSSYAGAELIAVDVGSVFLAQGTYWLEVAPFSGGIFNSTGANAIGVQVPAFGDSVIRSWPYFNQNYIELGNYGNMSSGVAGSVGVPENATTLFCLAMGIGGLMVAKFRRKAGN